jgi:hypothetical protein
MVELMSAAAADGGGEISDRALRTCRAPIVAVCLGFAASLILSWPLWRARDAFPHVPVWSGFSPPGAPWDLAYPLALCLSLGACVAWLRPRLAAGLTVLLLVLLVLQDQQRLQPWAYLYGLILARLALTTPDDRGVATLRHDLRLLIGCMYLWSGLHKLNLEFVEEAFPWMLEPLTVWLPEPLVNTIQALGWGAPVLEAAIGLGLLSRIARRPALLCCLAMHLGILIMMGPWGHGWNAVVWPWNFTMMALVVWLFGRAEAGLVESLRPRDITGAVLLIVVGLAPGLHFSGHWDAYPAFALYSASTESASFILAAEDRERLPAAARPHAEATEPGPLQLSADHWALAELGVPAYPEHRVFVAMHAFLCNRMGAESEVHLLTHERGRLSGERTFTTYECGNPEPLQRTVVK